MTTEEIKQKARTFYEAVKGFPFDEKPFTALDAEEIAVHFYNEASDEHELKITEKENARKNGVGFYIGNILVSEFIVVPKGFYVKDVLHSMYCSHHDTTKEAKFECIQICNEFINKLKQK